MTHPFELTAVQLQDRLDEMVEVTFGDLQSQFLTLPRGAGFIDYGDFQTAYEVLKRETQAFATFTEDSVWKALRHDALTLVVLRTILGFSPPEWADLATVREANQRRLCVDCGAPDAELVRTTRGANPGRRLRICAACWRSGRWDEFGLVEREPIAEEVPTEYVDGRWIFPTAEGPEPEAVVTPEAGVGWCWWALGEMGDAPNYEVACEAAERAIVQKRERGRCASCVHRHHPHAVCTGRSGGTGWACGCTQSEARK